MRDVPTARPSVPTGTPHPPQGDEQTTCERQKSHRANVNIAILNVNGYAAPTNNMTGIEKWSTIYQSMKENKLAILAVQESHLNDTLIHSINECFGKRITIINSQHPTNPRSSARVAFVINKALITTKNLESVELIKGRAIAIKFKWHEENDITLINVYAPNNRAEHQDFWEKIDTCRQARGLRHPDMLLGDFNLTEDTIDRAPAHLDNVNAIAALRNLRQCLGVKDSWRHTFPNERAFSYRANSQGTQVMSRLDSIYLSDAAENVTSNWVIKQTLVPTDHWLVAMNYAPNQAPHIGKDRWTFQVSELKNEKLMEKITNQGKQLKKDLQTLAMTPTACETENPQTLWATFKDDIVKTAKKHCAESRGKLAKKINDLEKELKNLQRNQELDLNDTIRPHEAALASKLGWIECIWARDKRDDLRAIITNHREVLGGIWSSMNKDRKPRDLLYKLRSPDGENIERDSRKMATLARDYHEKLQNKDLPPQEHPANYKQKLEASLREIPESQKLTTQNAEKTDWMITHAQVMKALKLSKNGTATGLDRCPYELWKELDKLHETAKEERKERFDVIATLTTIFQDIHRHRADPRANFAHSWMCPIYKKKDPTNISNYRPITLLNTDYKLLTKTLALQIVELIHQLIHPDQARFIPKRPIFNHIRLASMITNYAEVLEEDRAIVALDQEKVYDKINHAYLWKTLETFSIPNNLIDTVRSLYKNASTKVAINGILSEPF